LCGGYGIAAEFCEDGFDEMLGLGARDEDGGGDVESEAVELLFAGDVLKVLVGEAAVDCGFVGGLLDRCEGAIGVGIEGGTGDPERVEEEDEGVAGGVGAEVGRRVELSSCAGEGCAESGGNGQGSVLAWWS
jgi:hypothetical protein